MAHYRKHHSQMGIDPNLDTAFQLGRDLGPCGGFITGSIYKWAIDHLDDWGRLEANPHKFRLLAFPTSDLTDDLIDRAFDLIAQAGLWLRYEVDGRSYVQVNQTCWWRHQCYIDKGKRARQGGTIPRPTGPEAAPWLADADSDRSATDRHQVPQRGETWQVVKGSGSWCTEAETETETERDSFSDHDFAAAASPVRACAREAPESTQPSAEGSVDAVMDVLGVASTHRERVREIVDRFPTVAAAAAAEHMREWHRERDKWARLGDAGRVMRFGSWCEREAGLTNAAATKPAVQWSSYQHDPSPYAAMEVQPSGDQTWDRIRHALLDRAREDALRGQDVDAVLNLQLVRHDGHDFVLSAPRDDADYLAHRVKPAVEDVLRYTLFDPQAHVEVLPAQCVA